MDFKLNFKDFLIEEFFKKNLKQKFMINFAKKI